MATAKEQSRTRVRLEDVRFSYANVFEPKAVQQGQDPKYSVSLIISKKNKSDIAKVKAAIQAAYEEGSKILKGKSMTHPKFKNPLHDGDDEKPNDEAYTGCMYVNANSKRKPQIVDRAKNPISNSDQFWSGDYGKATVNFFAFDKGGGFGIGAGLQNLQKTRDGEALSSISSADDDFDEVDDYSDDDL